MTPMNHDDERRTSTEDILAGVRADEEPGTRERPVYPGEATTAAQEPRTDDPERPEYAEDREEPDGGAEAAGGTTGRAVEGEPRADGDREGHDPLLPPDEADELRTRWQEIQTRFVDDPREAVRDADELVADLMRRLAEYFAGRKQGLESRWNRDGETDTEELRMALKQYRAFFDRLLSS
ncbi:hypothetical protein [Streptomyces sp. Y1]|uniref:Uncharacterized protein n=1 Tax=Streptomyces sp. Y1 TaxID=3238634 RepID=A0AB39TVA5_9ACTN